MGWSENDLKQIGLRFLVITGTGLAVGFAVFRSAIFVTHLWAFQITMASITVGLFYSVIRTSSLRNALAALLVWCIASNAIVSSHHLWMMVMSFVYVGGLACAVYVYTITVSKNIVRNFASRIASLIVCTAIANALIVFVLALLRIPFERVNLLIVPKAILFNLEVGTLIGVALGIGIELANYAIAKLDRPEKNVEDRG